MPNVHTLTCETTIPAPLAEVFAFFSEAENLQKLTPASLQFQILTPLPIEMKPGAIIDYRLKLMGVPFKWQTEITVWEPGKRFVDVQRKGPYLLWEHEHEFTASGESTLMVDRLRYATPGGPVEPLVTALFVRRRVEAIFSYRDRAIRQYFGQPRT